MKAGGRHSHWASSQTFFAASVLLLLLALLIQRADGLRGLGLPHKELWSSDRLLLESANNTRVNAAGSNSTQPTGLTVSGLKDELGSIKDRVKDEEERHSKATVAAAATIGSLLLLGLIGCAGVLVYRRFVRSQHTGKKSRADKALPYYDADRLLGDPAGL